MGVGDIVVYFIAAVAVAILLFLALKQWEVTLVGGAVLAIVVIGLLLGPLVAKYIDEQAQMKGCLTAHERRAKAAAAPDDYFGRQLREAAAKEATACAELAARKEAEKR
jgi:hypothetical protein